MRAGQQCIYNLQSRSRANALGRQIFSPRDLAFMYRVLKGSHNGRANRNDSFAARFRLIDGIRGRLGKAEGERASTG